MLARYRPDGTLDEAFGEGGVVTTSFGGHDFIRDIKVQPDGKILAGGFAAGNSGDFALARYNSDGSLDPMFSDDGRLNTDFGDYDVASGIALAANGKITLAGAAGDAIGLVRYTTDGNLDTTFGTGGQVVTPGAHASYNLANAVTVADDGKIIAAGYLMIPCDRLSICPEDFALARYLDSGQLDPAFGSAGRVALDLGSDNERIGAVAVQSDGKIVVAGYTSSPGSRFDFVVARYNSNGSLDPTFGVEGKVVTDFNGDGDRAYAIAIQDDGKIILAGSALVSPPNLTDFGLVRYLPDGTLDPAFGNGGKVTADFGNHGDVATSIYVESNGSITIGGYTLAGGLRYDDFALARFTSDGNLDLSFSLDGKVTRDLGKSDDKVNALEIDSEGRIVVAGGSTLHLDEISVSDFALLRYLADGSLDSTFGNGGIVFTEFGGITNQAYDLSIEASGEIIAAGSANGDFALARYKQDGSLDGTFGTGGKELTDFGANDAIKGIALVSGGRLIAAGTTNGGIAADFALARYLLHDAPPPPTATPTPVPPRCPDERFTDVCPEDYFYEPVLSLNDANIISGYNTVPPCDNDLHIPCFRPYSDITRGQVSKVVSLAAGFSEPVSGQIFEDVPSSHLFYLFIGRMAGRGIIGGYPCGGEGEPCVPPNGLPYFRPANNLTRGQLSKMVSQAFGFSGFPTGETFQDVTANGSGDKCREGIRIEA